MDEVLYDVSPLEFCDVLLGKPYFWKSHVVYYSRPQSVIITLGNKLYNISEVASPTTISLITTNQCSKIISQTKKFVFLMIFPSWKEEDCGHSFQIGLLFTATADGQGRGGVQGHFLLTYGVPLHCQVKHSINLTPGVSLPNGPIYQRSVLENDEIKRQI